MSPIIDNRHVLYLLKTSILLLTILNLPNINVLQITIYDVDIDIYYVLISYSS